MGLRHTVLIVASTLIAFSAGIPTTLVEEIKSSELRNNKVKRAHPTNVLNVEDNDVDISYYKPAIKRGANLDVQPVADLQWEQDQADLINRNYLPNVSSSLYRYPDGSSFDDDKKLSEYEKGYRYGTNKDSLDEALENAVLKSELYGDPAAINQYRYYGAESAAAAAAKKRKRRDAKKLRLEPRLKREVELSPEEVLTLLSLYENSRQHQIPQSENYRYPWTRFEPSVDPADSQEQQEESWLDTPVYPHASSYEKDLGPKYIYESDPQDMETKGRWRGFGVDNRNKRFMVLKRRSADPTRELRYINGPNKNDFYTLSQLLSNQRGPDMPVHRRLIL